MDNFEAVVGLKYEKNVVVYKQGKIYGLAYINPFTKVWVCNAGTLPYLYGLYQSFTSFFELLPEDLLPEEDDYYMGTVFFELNKNLEPIKIITAIKTTPQFYFETEGITNNMSAMMVDISSIDGDNIPKLEFEL